MEALGAANVKLFTQVSMQDPQQPGTVDFRPSEWSAALRPLTTATDHVVLSKAWKDVEIDNRAEFRDGRVLLMRNWPISYAILTTSDPSKNPPVTPGIALVPGGHGVLGGQNLAIARASAHPRAARALIQFLTSEQMQIRLAKFGGFAPTRRAAYDGWPAPYAKTVLRAINDAYVRPVTPYYPMFSSVFRDGICYARVHDGNLPPGLGAALNQALAGRQVTLTGSCPDN
jgi:multiple sugar transport system substrate-binding protein